MTESKIDSFNIEPLVFEIENVIKNGLKVMLKDYIDRHDLLEKTHKQIMKLPSVMNEINKGCESDSDSEDNMVEDKSMFVSISNMTHDLVKKEISYVESKLDRIEKKYESISPLISKILDKLESINDEVKVLKENPRDNIKVVHMDQEKPYISNIIKPSIVSACENENIKFEINEDEYEESDEDDINPALITCSTISIKQEVTSDEQSDNESEEDKVEVVEPVKVKKEVIVIEEEEDDELSVGQELGEHEEQETTPEEEDEDEEEEEEEHVQSETKEDKVEEEADEDEVETEASDDEEEEEEEEVVVPPAPTKEEENVEDEGELEIITIDDIDYCTNDLENGFIWELSEDGEQGDKIGYLKEGEPFFYADEN
jgi:hypothetical protein